MKNKNNVLEMMESRKAPSLNNFFFSLDLPNINTLAQVQLIFSGRKSMGALLME